ncbi:hypothetical protein [Streptomyces sp. WAC01280]|uniref:hypothetical protein n=1 Tax=Streptomyces sp. WAC01280 TaxID=2487424 RepID=UPI000F793110|nr:hypothetical protein [Streptomyces sp. WAC01280]RSS51497.1 hypothetical protein EF909_35040 [Streptomyces sp. WAC01280]
MSAAAKAPRGPKGQGRARGRKPEFFDTPLGTSLFVVLMGGIAVRDDTPAWVRVVCALLALAFLGNLLGDFVAPRVRSRVARFRRA